MEHGGAVMDTIWNSFDASMAPVVEEPELMSQLLGAYSFLNEQADDQSLDIPSMLWSENAADPYYCSQNVDSNLYYWPLENPSCMVTTPSLPFTTPSLQFAPSFCSAEDTSSDDSGNCHITPPLFHGQKPQPKRKSNAGEDVNVSESSKKSRASAQVQRSTKNAKSTKTQKSTKSADEEKSNRALNGQSSSYYSSEDDANATQVAGSGGSTSFSSRGSAALSLNGKTRAARGSATDPQSLYARKRRERINERLRILQNLVPNGTKIDTSTMLEEAVQYVKFLQLQIKLLSSDELWMYTPIAYNGINIGLNLKITPPGQWH